MILKQKNLFCRIVRVADTHDAVQFDGRGGAVPRRLRVPRHQVGQVRHRHRRSLRHRHLPARYVAEIFSTQGLGTLKNVKIEQHARVKMWKTKM